LIRMNPFCSDFFSKEDYPSNGHLDPKLLTKENTTLQRLSFRGVRVIHTLYIMSLILAVFCVAVGDQSAEAFQSSFIVKESIGSGQISGKSSEVAAGNKKERFAIVIHGGAGGSPSRNKAYNEKRQKAMEKALAIGEKVLSEGGSSLEAVEKVIRFREDNPMFNSGRGAVFTAEGKFELDSSIMVGNDLRCGAAASVCKVRHPISLASKVMENSGHVFLVKDGAEKFARSQNLEMVPNDFFWTDRSRKVWKRYQKTQNERKSSWNSTLKQDGNLAIAGSTLLADYWSSHKGTVGCVALDTKGNICAGTSTGGMSGKRFGRVGDSPINGAGNYADNRSCGISGTGWGEQFIRNAVAYQISARMRFGGQSLKQATSDVLTKELNQNDGGVVGLDAKGNVVALYNTSAMAYAYRDGDGNKRVVWSVRGKTKKATSTKTR